MSKIHSIPQENIQSHIDSIVREVLDGDYKKVSISQLDISEDLKNDSTLISCDMFLGGGQLVVSSRCRAKHPFLVDDYFLHP